VVPLTHDFDPFASDPGRWGASLANNAEILLACLAAAQARSVVEVGAYAGDVTRLLLEWAVEFGAQVVAIDPAPEPALIQLAGEHDDLELIRATSLDALREISLPDAMIIDGDHNYYTVSQELSAISAAAGAEQLPLLLFHDVCWPHARRDDYFDPQQIPAEARQPYVAGAGLFPGEPGLCPGGLPFRFGALREGGPRNGVLTAIEDFVAEREGLALAVVPAFFGLGVVWDTDAPWSDAIAACVEPWHGNHMLERMEANRVFHLASTHVQMVQAGLAQQRNARTEDLLRRLLESKTFAIAVLLSRFRQRGAPAFSKDEVRELLAD
jgi:hypothetical protein